MATFTHFHCGWCDSIETCDCPCIKCTTAKQVAAEKAAAEKAAAAPKPTGGAVGGAQPVKEYQCWNCGAYADEDCRRGCLEERVDIRNAEAAKEKRKADKAMKKKGCTCEKDADYWCDYCHWEEDNRCKGCGSYPGEDCRPDCDGGYPEECRRCGRVDCWC